MFPYANVIVKNEPIKSDDIDFVDDVLFLHNVVIKCEKDEFPNSCGVTDDRARQKTIICSESEYLAEGNVLFESVIVKEEPKLNLFNDSAITLDVNQSSPNSSHHRTKVLSKKWECYLCRYMLHSTVECNRKFSDASAFRRHKQTHSNERPFACELCDQRCSRKSTLRRHLTTHTGTKAFVCNICDKRFSRNSTLNHHRLLHIGEFSFQCTKCERKFVTKSTLNYHLRTHIRKPFKYDGCDRSFTTEIHLHLHQKTHKNRTMPSEFCRESLPSNHEQNVSLQSSKKNEAIVTKSKAKKRKSSSHTENFRFESLILKKEPKLDVRHHSKKTLESSKLDRDSTKMLLDNWECYICRYIQHSSVDLRRHIRKHVVHKIPFICGQCGRKFSRKSNLKQHEATHTNGGTHVSCNQCDRTFAGRAGLLYHHKRIHTIHTKGEKRFPCDQCNRTFLRRSTLSQHKLIHSGIKRFACHECDRNFTDSSTLYKHKQTHSKERPFACDLCHQRCSRKSTLRRHLATHTGEKAFVCNICGKKFSRNSTLNHHKLLHKGEFSFQCNKCERKFVTKSTLNYHLQTHNDGQIFECDLCDKSFAMKPSLNQHKKTHLPKTTKSKPRNHPSNSPKKIDAIVDVTLSRPKKKKKSSKFTILMNKLPTPIELISQFLSIAPENQSTQSITSPDIESALNKNEGLKIGHKQLALKILGLKVASHLKWNLEILEKNLPLQKQVRLLSDLCSVTSGKFVSLPLSLVHECHLGPEGSKRAFNFALTMYHRWVLRVQVLKELPARIVKPGFGHVLGAQEQANSFRDEMFVESLKPFTQTSIDFLTQICDDDDFIALTYDSFVALTSNSERTSQNFDQAIVMSKIELRAQIYFDLCTFYLHIKNYDLARNSAIACRNNLDELKEQYEAKGQNEFVFCTLNEDELKGCMFACGARKQKLGLLHRMNESMLHQYKDITDILKEDNLNSEIPLVNRRILELDIEGSVSSRALQLPKDLLLQVAALNTIKTILDEQNLFSYNDYLQKYKKQNGLVILVDEVATMLTSPLVSLESQNKLKKYFLNAMLSSDDMKYVDVETIRKTTLFSNEKLQEIKKQRNSGEISLPPIAAMTDWKMGDTKNSRLEVGAMKRQLISCTNANVVRKLLVKLMGTNPVKPLWTINPSWTAPIPLDSVIKSMQRCFLQDFAFVLVGKARELAAKSDFKTALTMLAALKSETQRPDVQNIQAVSMLGKLVEWEILFIQVYHTLEDWPKPRYDRDLLITKCKQCLLTLEKGEPVLPRIEIFDYCAAMLLNLNEWNAIVTADKRFASLELCSIFASALMESDSFKGKKIGRDAFDLVLPMFMVVNKRGGQGQNSRDSPKLAATTNLMPFLKKLRHVPIISIVLSLLAKLFNILKDDSNMEINVEYLGIWPTSISNASAYSIRSVSETLPSLVKQGLKYYPQYFPWLRLTGEIEFANENNEAAMACYTNVLITGSEYCSSPLQRPLNERQVIDDHLMKRMIKCCLNLGCNMQAAILCQFLEDVDYVLAFKSLSEKSNRAVSFSDAMDAYYDCIWDPTLLEFIIHQHSRKGEHKRKQQAIAVMGQLELNANNNDEIKREAASIRRTRFLRALANQYML